MMSGENFIEIKYPIFVHTLFLKTFHDFVVFELAHLFLFVVLLHGLDKFP